MIDVQKRLKRIQRIHGLETCQLNLLVVQLAKADSDLAEQNRQVLEMYATKEQGLTDPSRCSLEMLTQNGRWIDSIHRAINVALKAVEETESKRRKLESKVLDQRGRVRGLETLMDQMRVALKADAETQTALMADENALKDYTRN